METREQTEAKTAAARKQGTSPIVVPPVDAKLPPSEQADQNQMNVLLTGDPALTLSREAIEGSDGQPPYILEVSPETQLAQQVVRLESRLNMLEAQLSQLLANPQPPSTVAGETIEATMVGTHFNCPECGLRITTPAMIATQGKLTGGYYEHPFGGSPRLGDMPCRLMGKKFYSPVVTLKLVQNLTAKQ